MKKVVLIFCIALMLVLTLSLVACNEQEGEKPAATFKYVEGMDDFEYYAEGSSVSLISPKDKTKKSVTIPACVTEIYSAAFDGCSSLEEVKFANGSKLKDVLAFAFRDCTSLKSISLPSSVKTIGNKAFSGCTSLETVEYDEDKITSFGTCVFENCSSLKSVTVPGVVTTIGSKDFVGCTSLEEVILCDGVTKVENDAFRNSPVNSLSLPNTLREIGDYAFYSNALTGKLVIPEGVEKIGALAFAAPQLFKVEGGITELELPSSLVSIGALAFYSAKLPTLDIPKNVKSIGVGAFFNSAPTAVTLPDSFIIGTDIPKEWIKSNADIKKLTDEMHLFNWSDEMTWSIPSANVDDYDEYSQRMIKYALNGAKNLTIRSGLLEKDAIENNDNLENIALGDGVEIEAGALDNTKWYREQPDGVVYSGNVVYGCKGTLPFPTTLTIKEGTTKIAEKAFFGQINVTALELPKSLKQIGRFAFVGTAIDRISVSDENTSFAAEGNCLLSSDKKTLVLGCFSSTIPSTVEKIGEYAFAGTYISSINVPKGVKTIGKYAFAECPRLTTVIFENESVLTTIDEYAFAATDITSMDFQSLTKLESVGDYAFEYTNMTSVTLPDSVTTLGICPFGTGLKNIEINQKEGEEQSKYYVKNNYVIDRTTRTIVMAVEGCGSIPQSFTYVDKVKVYDVIAIGDYAFSGVKTFDKTLVIPSTITSIGQKAFAGTPISSIEFATRTENDRRVYDLQSVDQTAFGDCTSLSKIIAPVGIISKINLPDSVSRIEITGDDDIPDEFLVGHTGVRSVIIAEGVKRIGDMAFSGCGLTSLTIPASTTSLGYGVGAFCPLESCEIASENVPSAEARVKGYNGSTVNVIFDKCNLFANVDGVFSSIGSHTARTISQTTIGGFDELYKLYEAYIKSCEKANGEDVNEDASSKEINDGYARFYDKAIELFKTSVLDFARNAKADSSSGAIVGINNSFTCVGSNATFVFGDEKSEAIDLQALVAKMYGFESKDDFIQTVGLIVKAFENVSGSVDSLGGFNTENGFVFPIAIQSDSAGVILSCVVLDAKGNASVWINDVKTALSATNFDEKHYTKDNVTNKLFCKYELFSTFSPKYYIKNNYVIDKESRTIVMALDGCGEIPTSYTMDKTTRVYDVVAIGAHAFFGSSVERIVIPGNVKEIGYGAFENSAVKEVVMQKGVESIGKHAFFGAENLETVTVPDSVSFIGAKAFDKTPFLEAKKLGGGVVYVGKVVYAYSPKTITDDQGNVKGVDNPKELVIEDGTTGFAEHALEYLSSLKKIVLPSSIKIIGQSAFFGCKSLSEIYFNGSFDEWNGVEKGASWDTHMPKKNVWTLCQCTDKNHDHNHDGEVDAVGRKCNAHNLTCENLSHGHNDTDNLAADCKDQNKGYVLNGADMCDECFAWEYNQLCPKCKTGYRDLDKEKCKSCIDKEKKEKEEREKQQQGKSM